MAHDAHHHDGPTAAMRPACGLGFETDIYSRSILDRLSTSTRFSPQTSPRIPRARSAEPAMSGYYHHPGDGLFPDEPQGGPPPLFLEGIDPALDDTASNASYGAIYSTSAQGPPGAPFVPPPHDAFGFGFVDHYDPGSYPPIDPAGGFSPSNYSIPTMTPPPNFSMGFEPSPNPAIGGSSSTTTFDASASGPLGTPFLSPNPTHSPPPLSSRSQSPNSTSNLDEYGIFQPDGTWTCAYPGCRSTVAFARPCDLRKHYHRHEKRYFCRHDGCERSEAGARRALEEGTSQDQPAGGLGYGTRKDRDRHERTHNPSIPCLIEGCHRRFARADNMRDHYKRIHLKGSRRR